jgi:hypothetical protein
MKAIKGIHVRAKPSREPEKVKAVKSPPLDKNPKSNKKSKKLGQVVEESGRVVPADLVVPPGTLDMKKVAEEVSKAAIGRLKEARITGPVGVHALEKVLRHEDNLHGMVGKEPQVIYFVCRRFKKFVVSTIPDPWDILKVTQSQRKVGVGYTPVRSGIAWWAARKMRMRIAAIYTSVKVDTERLHDELLERKLSKHMFYYILERMNSFRYGPGVVETVHRHCVEYFAKYSTTWLPHEKSNAIEVLQEFWVSAPYGVMTTLSHDNKPAEQILNALKLWTCCCSNLFYWSLNRSNVLTYQVETHMSPYTKVDWWALAHAAGGVRSDKK